MLSMSKPIYELISGLNKNLVQIDLNSGDF